MARNTHPHDQTAWTLAFIDEYSRLDPQMSLGEVDTLARTLWTLKGKHGMWPEEAAQRTADGDFGSFGRPG